MNNNTTIVLPVYGRSELLAPALASVIALENPDWQLLIADDGSDLTTQKLLKHWIAQQSDPRIRWVRRSHNLGLFANLNQAIREAETDWVLLLCSDDLLLPTALTTLKQLRNSWPTAELVVSTFVSISEDNSTRPADSAWHHDHVSLRTALIPPEQFVPALLQHGSLNGNLSGMAFTRTLWQQVGPFRGDWRHAADWEWLARAAEQKPLLLNREPIAAVRTHSEQLSNSNRRSGHELQEVAEVVRYLRHHPLLAQEPRRHAWAAQIMQFQLWNQLRQLISMQARTRGLGLRAIRTSAGLRRTARAMIIWIPERIRRFINKARN